MQLNGSFDENPSQPEVRALIAPHDRQPVVSVGVGGQTACRQCGCHQCGEHGWLNKVGVHSTEYKHTRRIHGELHKKSHGLLNPAYGTGAFLTVSSRM